MAPFTKAEFSHMRLDCHAIVDLHGVASIEATKRDTQVEWLRSQGYVIFTVDCTLGLDHVAAALGNHFQWQKQFRYAYEASGRGLDALRDGFQFDVPNKKGGFVFELLRPDVLWQDEPAWVLGLLAIAREHSAYQLAFGRRFFTLLVLPPRSTSPSETSPFIGQVYERLKVPWPFPA